jgi:hypothetical protein
LNEESAFGNCYFGNNDNCDCNWLLSHNGVSSINTVINKTLNPVGCPPLAEGFSTKELVGTWAAGSLDQSDTLIINSNGTYKQVIHVEFVDRSPIDYESSWQPWRFEYSSDHIGYLHLEGFRFCGMNAGISCEESDRDGYDFCHDERIKMKDEGNLLVFVAKGERFIHLAYPLGFENSWSYHRQEP